MSDTGSIYRRCAPADRWGVFPADDVLVQSAEAVRVGRVPVRFTGSLKTQAGNSGRPNRRDDLVRSRGTAEPKNGEILLSQAVGPGDSDAKPTLSWLGQPEVGDGQHLNVGTHRLQHLRFTPSMFLSALNARLVSTYQHQLAPQAPQPCSQHQYSRGPLAFAEHAPQ